MPLNRLFFTEPVQDRVRRSELDGSMVTDIVTTTLDENRGISHDPVTQLLWIIDKNTQSIRTALYDGTLLTTILTNPDVGTNPSSITVDSVNGKIYWNKTNGADRDILRANLDGSTIETVITDRNIFLHKVDPVSQKVYYGSEGGLRRVDGDGNNDELLYTSTSLVAGIALDVRSDRLYWCDETAGEIWVGNLDGTLAEVRIINTALKVYDMDIDVPRGHLYYVHGAAKDTIKRVDTDGSNDQLILTGGTGVQIWGVILVDAGGNGTGLGKSGGWPQWNIYIDNRGLGHRTSRTS